MSDEQNHAFRREALKYPIVAAGISAFAGRAAGTEETLVVGDGGAFDGIQAAVDAAATGDTVEVRDGVYTETVTIDKSIALVGDSGESNAAGPGAAAPVIDGEERPNTRAITIADHVDGVTIDGFEIRNFGSAPEDGQRGRGIVLRSSSSGAVRNCHFHCIHGVQFGIFPGAGVEDWVVERNVFEPEAETAIQIRNCSGLDVRGNEIEAPSEDGGGENGTLPYSGIRVWSVADEAGVDAVTDGVRITDNAIRGSAQNGGIRVHVQNFSEDDGTVSRVSNLEIRNNDVAVVAEHGIQWIVGTFNWGPADRPPHRLENVTCEENAVTNSRIGIALTAWPGGDGWQAREVTIADNELSGDFEGQAQHGINVHSWAENGVADVLVDGNGMSNYLRGFFALSVADDAIGRISLTENTTHHCGSGSHVSVTPFAPWVVDDESAATHTISRGIGTLVHEDNQFLHSTHSGIWLHLDDRDDPGAYVGDDAFGEVEIRGNDCSAGERYGMAIASLTEGGYGSIDVTQNHVRDNRIGCSFQRPIDPESVTVTGNDFVGNDEYGAEQLPPGEDAALDEDPEGETQSEVGDSTEPLDLTCNYWGDPTGPDHAANRRPGRGDTVSDGLRFDPFLPQSFERVPETACGNGPGNGSGNGSG